MCVGNADTRPMGTRCSAATLLALSLLAACDEPAPPRPPPEPPPPPPSSNVIDVAVWPRMIADGLTALTPASTDELCRRMGLDLLGVTPAPDDVAAACVGKTPAEMARAFMARPRFAATERRFWIRRMGNEPTWVMADHLADADRLYDALGRGELGYADFAARVLAHPVMTVNRPLAAGDDVTQTVTNIFRVFLGRSPSVAELADYTNLLRPWRRVTERRDSLGYMDATWPAVIDPEACRDQVLGVAGCTSKLLGAETAILPVVTAQAPAGFDTNPRLFYYETVQGAVPAALQAELEKPGRLLATRDEFWDEAAELALRRLLGWWRSTAAEPDTVLPEVTLALSTWFAAQPGHDVRELYATVMSSVLYTSAARVGADSGPRPPWGTGPVKTLEPEQLLDSVSRALDRPLGLCDPHTSQGVDNGSGSWPTRLRPPQPADWYGFGRDYYRAIAVELGDCQGALATPRQPGLKATFAHIELAERLCRAPSKILPADLSPTDTTPAAIDRLTDHLIRGFLARPATADEQAAVRTAATACFADPACQDLGGLARETCGALLRSSAFLYY